MLKPCCSTWHQGNRARLEKVMMKLITGQPVSLVLLGGSISIRGWNHPDEAYIRQVGRQQWLALMDQLSIPVSETVLPVVACTCGNASGESTWLRCSGPQVA
jgi:hypothetical protein